MPASRRRKYHYVYYSYEPWGRGYIGKRTCLCKPEEDTEYFGSFSDKSFKPTEKIILGEFETSEQALEAEIALHNFYKVTENPHFANRARQTSKFFNTEGIPKAEEHKEKIRLSNLGQKRSSEAKLKMSLAKIGNKHCVGKRNGLGNKSRTGFRLTIEERLLKAMLSHPPSRRMEVTSPAGVPMCPLNLTLFGEEHGIHPSHLRNVANGRGRTIKGWSAKWCDQFSSSSSSPRISSN
jgi:hypothetical protein